LNLYIPIIYFTTTLTY